MRLAVTPDEGPSDDDRSTSGCSLCHHLDNDCMKNSTTRVHLVDIAKLAGVSSATVSRVINGSRPVSPDLRERVLATVRRFDYQPSQLARNLRRGRSATVGVLISDVENPHFATMVKYLEEALYLRGAPVLFCNPGEDPSKQSSYLDVMAAERVTGVVISPAVDGDAAVSRLMDLGTPVVAIDRPLSDPRADVVVVNNAAAVEAGTQLLIDSGCRQIGCIGGREGVWTTTERLAGYKSAMDKAGLAPHSVLSESTRGMGYQAAGSLLDELGGLDGLMIASNQMAIGVLRLLQARQIQVPQHLRVVAFDDSPWADLIQPSLTTIAQPLREMAEAAVEQLFRRLDDPSPPPSRVTLDCELKVRCSTGPVGPVCQGGVRRTNATRASSGSVTS
jgi:DNA-binding LacI/PurR family transcriptional regulator